MSPTRLTIYGLLCIAVMIFAAGWLRGSSMMASLFAETLGIVLVVLLVDTLIALELKKARRPAALAAYREAIRLFYHVEDIIWAAAVSSIPNLDITKVRDEKSATTEPWLVGYISRLHPAQDSNRTRFVEGQFVALPWGTLLYDHQRTIEHLVSKYIEKHAVIGDPNITAAIYNIETNRLFRELNYGPAVFWNKKNCEAGWSDFLQKCEALRSELALQAHKYPEVAESVPDFAWSRLVDEVSGRSTDVRRLS